MADQLVLAPIRLGIAGDPSGEDGGDEQIYPFEECPNTNCLTTGSLDGTGVFDVLMRSVGVHLLEEFQANRITGKEYATVYLGAINSALAQSVQFIVNHQQVNKIRAEIGLLRQKTVSELAQTRDNIPFGLGFNHLPGEASTVAGLMAVQQALFAKQTDGFDRDAEQKLAKMMIDTWAVRQTTDGGAVVNTNGLCDTEIAQVLDKAKVGIDVTPGSCASGGP